MSPSGAQVELIEQPFTCITCSSILLVNLERIGFNLRNFDMTIVFKVRDGAPFLDMRNASASVQRRPRSCILSRSCK